MNSRKLYLNIRQLRNVRYFGRLFYNFSLSFQNFFKIFDAPILRCQICVFAAGAHRAKDIEIIVLKLIFVPALVLDKHLAIVNGF